MKPSKILAVALVSGIAMASTQLEFPTSNLIQGSSEGRYFPLLPPYHDVDFAANFNKLKSPGDTAYFVVRDTIVYVGVQAMWVVLHTFFWDGEASNLQDVITSLTSPGHRVELSNPDRNSRLSLQSLNEISFVKLWNFFASPDASTRNLYLSFGFTMAQQLLWIIPTFLGSIPDPDAAAKIQSGSTIDRTVGLPEQIADSDPAATWNRIFSPQGILQIIGINTLLWGGKIVFWWVMSNLQDVPAATVISGRKIQEENSRSLLSSVADGFMEEVKFNVELMINNLESSQQSWPQ